MKLFDINDDYVVKIDSCKLDGCYFQINIRVYSKKLERWIDLAYYINLTNVVKDYKEAKKWK